MRRVPLVLLVLCFAIAGCLNTATVTCADGRVCPIGTVCEDAYQLCLVPSQLVDCVEVLDGTECSVDGRAAECQQGLCVEEICGDGIRSGREDCDLLDLDDKRCPALGYYDDGPLTCDDRCNFIEDACSGTCRDMTLDDEELCDLPFAPAGTCLDFGFDAGTLGCTEQCAPDIDGCTQLGWQRMSSATPRAIHGVERADGSSYVLGVGEGGKIIQLDGDGWTPHVASGVAVNLHDVWVTSETDAWTVGEQGTILHFDGAAWTSMVSGTNRRLTAIWASSPSNAYAVGDSATVLHWNGTSWQPVALPLPPGSQPQLFDVFGVDGELFVVGDFTLARRDALGTWQVVPTGASHVAIWGHRSDDVWVIGFVSDAAGTRVCDLRRWTSKWSEVNDYRCPLATINVPGYGGAGVALWGTARDDIWAVREGSPPMRFDGLLWTTVSTPSSSTRAIGGAGLREGAFAAALDGIYRWPNRGWNDAARVRVNAVAIAGKAANDIYVTSPMGARHWDGTDWGLLMAYGEYVTMTSSGIVVVAQRGGAARFRTGTQAFSTADICSNCAVLGLVALGPTPVGFTKDSLYIGDMPSPSWTSRAPKYPMAIHDVWGTSLQDFFIALNDDVYHVVDDQWSALGHPAPSMIRDLEGIGTTLFTSTCNSVSDVEPCSVQRYDGTGWTALDNTVTESFPMHVHLRVIAEDDVFARGLDVTNASVLLHWNGTQWTPVRRDLGFGGAMWHFDARTLYIANDMMHVLDRTVPWDCATTETKCNDGADNDCDGARDAADLDCP